MQQARADLRERDEGRLLRIAPQLGQHAANHAEMDGAHDVGLSLCGGEQGAAAQSDRGRARIGQGIEAEIGQQLDSPPSRPGAGCAVDPGCERAAPLLAGGQGVGLRPRAGAGDLRGQGGREARRSRAPREPDACALGTHE